MDIYNDILVFLKHHPNGCQVTKLSYGAGLPIDRINHMLETLSRCELIKVNVLGQPLQENLNQRRVYSITRKGLEFLEAYTKIQGLFNYLETEPKKPTGGVPMDFLD
jgi:predicted transcriptional regulator